MIVLYLINLWPIKNAQLILGGLQYQRRRPNYDVINLIQFGWWWSHCAAPYNSCTPHFLCPQVYYYVNRIVPVAYELKIIHSFIHPSIRSSACCPFVRASVQCVIPHCWAPFESTVEYRAIIENGSKRARCMNVPHFLSFCLCVTPHRTTSFMPLTTVGKIDPFMAHTHTHPPTYTMTHVWCPCSLDDEPPTYHSCVI